MAKLQIGLKKSDYMFGRSYYVPVSEVNLDETFEPHDGDNDWNRRYETTKRYELVTVDAPEGITDHEYAYNQEQYQHLSMNYPTVSADWARRLIKLDREERNICIALLKVKTFRSDFRKSLRAQLESWLTGEVDYKSPFTPKQWQTQWATNVYRARRYA